MQEATMSRPQRWDQPFDPAMNDELVDLVLASPPFNTINASTFPGTTSLRDIILNDTRVIDTNRGDIVMRHGDYGSSAYVIINGGVRVNIYPSLLPDVMIGIKQRRPKSFKELFAQIFNCTKPPETRKIQQNKPQMRTTGDGEERSFRVTLEDVDEVLQQYSTVPIGAGILFGEIAALTRTPRTATVFAEIPTKLVEIRWQGLRDIRRYDKDFRETIDDLYRKRSLEVQLKETPILRHLSETKLQQLANHVIFDTFGEFDWNINFNRGQDSAKKNGDPIQLEPRIASEGHYLEYLYLIRSGFARVSQKVNHGHKTLSYLRNGDCFGLEEIIAADTSHKTNKLAHHNSYTYSLRAIGYVDVLKIPVKVVKELILPGLPREYYSPTHSLLLTHGRPRNDRNRKGVDSNVLELLVEKRFINGTSAMAIDTTRCVGCDECVRACALAHNNNPRFIRHGTRIDQFMITNACMHCVDPVCMIGCPTGAIQRDPHKGEVVINDSCCIGCATCAQSCPYDNIRMVSIRDENGHQLIDNETRAPILKATKCDLCRDQQVSPACERSCPHDALRRVDLSHFNVIRDWFI